MKMTKLVLAALLLFGTGVATGVVGSRLRAKAVARSLQQKRGTVPPPMWQRMEFLRKAQMELDLTPEQRERVDGYVKESQESVRRIWEPVAPRAKEEMNALRERIRGQLTPAQKERFDATLMERGRKGGRKPDRTTNSESRHPSSSPTRKPVSSSTPAQ